MKFALTKTFNWKGVKNFLKCIIFPKTWSDFLGPTTPGSWENASLLNTIYGLPNLTVGVGCVNYKRLLVVYWDLADMSTCVSLRLFECENNSVCLRQSIETDCDDICACMTKFNPISKSYIWRIWELLGIQDLILLNQPRWTSLDCSHSSPWLWQLL